MAAEGAPKIDQKKRVKVANHSIKLELPKAPIVNRDAVFRVRAAGRLLGTLTVSRGNLEWYSNKCKIPTRLNWERFDRLMHRRSRGHRAA
jgi:hypothetical protein